jgi:hypothetical protein
MFMKSQAFVSGLFHVEQSRFRRPTDAVHYGIDDVTQLAKTFDGDGIHLNPTTSQTTTTAAPIHSSLDVSHHDFPLTIELGSMVLHGGSVGSTAGEPGVGTFLFRYSDDDDHPGNDGDGDGDDTIGHDR